MTRGKPSAAKMIRRPHVRHLQRRVGADENFTHLFCHALKARGVENPVSRRQRPGLSAGLPVQRAGLGPGLFERSPLAPVLPSAPIQSLALHAFLVCKKERGHFAPAGRSSLPPPFRAVGRGPAGTAGHRTRSRAGLGLGLCVIPSPGGSSGSTSGPHALCHWPLFRPGPSGCPGPAGPQAPRDRCRRSRPDPCR